MDQVLGVRCRERLSYLEDDRDHALARDLFLEHLLVQILSRDELHHEIEEARVFLARREHADDVLMSELRHRARATLEAFPAGCIPCELRVEHLDGNALASDAIVRLPHRCETPTT